MNKLTKAEEFDSYELEEPSDEDRAEDSSEDELEVLLNGTPQQKKKLIREYLTGESESSSADEFEKEMEAELNTTIKTIEGTWGPATTAEAAVIRAGGAAPELPDAPMYDEVYFDSDDEQETNQQPSSSSGQRRKQRTVPTNDELLYDPEEDDRDQAWVDARRSRYNRKRPTASGRSQSGQTHSLASSDAILNCPACMTTLCLDCQRHDKYRTQYRAMFVMNCKVKRDEALRYKTQPERKPSNRKRRRGQQQNADAHIHNGDGQKPTPEGMEADEVYHPVQCSECNTEVAVFDKEEVYHFFNILTSHC